MCGVSIIIIIIIIVSCHRPFLPGTSTEPAVIPTAQASRWFRHCATTLKIAGSILDGANGIFFLT